MTCHTSTGPHEEVADVVIVGRVGCDEDAVIVECAVGHEHMEMGDFPPACGWE
jgi:hypothetical protein